MQDERKRYLDIATWLLVLVPIGIFLRYVNVYALNLPRQDDYDAILDFLINYERAGDGATKLSLLMAQHNEHRIFTSRLMFVLYHKLFGEFNFRHIIFLNATVLIGLFGTLAHFIRRALPSKWHAAVLGLSLCLFGLNHFENMDFAMAGMQNYGVILLMVGSVYCYSRSSNILIAPAVLLQALCVFSSGNGNLGSAFILLYCLLAKDKKRIIASLCTFLVFAPLYYYRYNPPPPGFFTLNMAKVMPFFLHVVGAHFSFDQGIPAAILLLVVLLVGLPVRKWLRIEQKDLPLLCIAGFILASVAVMSVFRANMPGSTGYSSRYFIYPALLTAFTFAFVLVKYGDNKMVIRFGVPPIVVLLLLCYNWNCKDGRNGFKGFNEELRTMEYHYPDKERGKRIADEACAMHIYCLEKNRVK